MAPFQTKASHEACNYLSKVELQLFVKRAAWHPSFPDGRRRFSRSASRPEFAIVRFGGDVGHANILSCVQENRVEDSGDTLVTPRELQKRRKCRKALFYWRTR